MKLLHTFYICFFNLLLLTGLGAQDFQFPEDWTGSWEGKLEIFSRSRMVRSIPMAVEVTDEGGEGLFAITYGEGPEADVRPYRWHTIDAAIGHFRIDEENGIYLDAFLADNCMMERFDVMKSALLIRFCLQEGNLIFETISTSTEPSWTSGDTIIDTDTIPQVESYFIPVVQKAVLVPIE